jgi:hypothetical protein
MFEVVELMTTSSDYLIREQRFGNVFWRMCHSGNTSNVDFTHEWSSMNTNGETSLILQGTSLRVLQVSEHHVHF